MYVNIKSMVVSILPYECLNLFVVSIVFLFVHFHMYILTYLFISTQIHVFFEEIDASSVTKAGVPNQRNTLNPEPEGSNQEPQRREFGTRKKGEPDC